MWERIVAGLGHFVQMYDPFLIKILELSLTKDSLGRPDWIQLSKHFAKDYYQFSNSSEFPSQSTLNNGIQLVRQTGLESQRSAFSYQPTMIYAGQEPTFTKYMQRGPGTLAMIPSVSNEGSSMYSQRISHQGQALINPSHVLQTSYSNISSIPPNSVFLPVGGSVGTSYYRPPTAPQRQSQTVSNHGEWASNNARNQENPQGAPISWINPQSVRIPSVSSASLPVKTQQSAYQTLTDPQPSTLGSNNGNFAPSPSFNQGEEVKSQELANDSRPKFTLPSSGFQYKSVFNNSEYMNYSPIINNYIRPAESISYETNRLP